MEECPYSPTPGAYAVVRLNPVEMVKALDDPQATAEAEAMKPKAYLAWLNLELALPFPDQPWYRFDICPIGLGIRPEDAESGITSDMCVPIGPNTSHPTGRKPVCPVGCFPYSGCYHWLDTEFTVRIRSRPEGFSERNGAKLSSRCQLRMERMWTADYASIWRRAAAASTPAVSADRATLEAQDPCDTHPQPTRVSPQSYEGTARKPVPPRGGSHCNDPHEALCASSSIALSTSTCRSVHSVAGRISTLAEMDIFGGPNDDVELIPLVDVWTSNLVDHLKQEDIPSPDEMSKEFKRITQYVSVFITEDLDLRHCIEL
ncbi:hypothetical protein OH77DRAFT_1412663 [Trametes cingulata]|nr:hypothetical protein OH77DRAFT_1412663 [Trametes cingulata]